MNWQKKVSVLMVAAIILTLGAGAVSAQEPRPIVKVVDAGALINAMAELSGLSAGELLGSAEAGSTLADLAAANGLTTEQVVAQATANLTERLNTLVENGRLPQDRAEEMLATLDADLSALMTQPLPQRRDVARTAINRIRDAGEQGLIAALSELTGLEPSEMLAQARENAYTTLAEIAEANGVALEDVVAVAFANATERINEAQENGNLTVEQAEDLLSRLQESLTNAMTVSLGSRFRDRQPVTDRPAPVIDLGRAALQAISEATGLDIQEILQQTREGSTLAEIITANGGDVDAVVNAIVEQFSTQFEEQIRRILNETRPAAAQRAPHGN
jgi:uncharacterized protein YidB (DUF937 family)